MSSFTDNYMYTSGDPDPLSGSEGRRYVVAEASSPGQLTSWDAVLAFVYAGNATFTLRSGTERCTYRVRKPKPDAEAIARYGQNWFVSLLRGPDNDSDYVYMGVIDGKGFHATKKSRMGQRRAAGGGSNVS